MRVERKRHRGSDAVNICERGQGGLSFFWLIQNRPGLQA